MCGAFEIERKDGEDESGQEAASKLAKEVSSVVKTADGEEVALSSLVAVSERDGRVRVMASVSYRASRQWLIICAFFFFLPFPFSPPFPFFYKGNNGSPTVVVFLR